MSSVLHLIGRYTSPYGENAISPAKIDTAERTESDKSKRLEDVVEKDYEKMFEEMVLTTPSSPEFDELHKIYRSDKVPDREDHEDRDGSEEESVAGTTESNYLANLVLSATEASNNETSEKNSSLYYNNGEIETKNYDITTNELKKTNENVTNESAEKRAKYLRPTNQHRAAIISAEGHDVVPTEESDMNLNIPNTAEVWALAGMKSVEHMKSKFNQFANKTSENLSDGNGVNTTSATKLLADWTEIMKNNEFSNSSVSSGDMEEKTMSNKSETTPEQMMGENNVISVLMTTKQPEDTATEIPENAVSRATTDGQEMSSVEATKESPSETMGDLEKSRRILNYDLVDSQEDNVNSSEKSESVQFTTDSTIDTSTQNIPSTVAESEDSATTTALYTDDGSTDVEYVTNHITNPMTTISASTTIDDREGSTTSSEPTVSAEISSEDLKTTTKAAQQINEDTTISNAIPTLSPTVTEQSDINQSTTTEDTSDISDNAAKTDRVNETKVENVMTTDKSIEVAESSTELSDQLKSTEDLNEVKYLPFPTSHRNLGNFSDEPLFDSTASSDEQKLTTIAPPQDLDGGQTMPEEGTDVNTIIAATVSVIVVIGVVAIVGFLVITSKYVAYLNNLVTLFFLFSWLTVHAPEETETTDLWTKMQTSRFRCLQSG